jgi:tetratricopeptide (TPR) repeat protein
MKGLVSLTFAILLLGQTAPSAAQDALERIEDLRRTGEYAAALELAEAQDAAGGSDPGLTFLAGELRLAIGDLDAAAAYFSRLAEGDDGDLMSAARLAGIHQQRGELAQAETLWRRIRDSYQTRASLDARDLHAIADATRALGRSDPQLFHEAVRLYDDAIRRDPSALQSGVALGELLLKKYNNAEALQVFAEVLDKDDGNPQALLGLARSQHFDYSAEAMETALRALSINPRLVDGRVFLARLYVEAERYDDARREIGLALDVNPRSLEALAMQAVIEHLQRDRASFDAIERQALELNPRAAAFYATLAELAAHNRLYRDAQDFAARAVELDAQSWRAYGLLGMNQMRLGKMREGRDNLERSFAGDPYNVWIKNTLQLADSFEDYRETERGRFRVMLHGDESALLDEYVHRLADEAFERFAARYRHRPEAPIRVEFYPSHADFSVRTVGLAGVGLLGVSFGPVVAMDSPAARERGAFNWGSTLWHELAHVFHLTLTDNRVPRWFSEGLAVYEERLARPGWGGDVDAGFLLAYRDGRLPPLSRLNDGFVRPTYPEQVVHSYFQASLAFEFIESRWGFDVIRETLAAYRDSEDPDSVLTSKLQIDSAALDAAFDEYLANRYATALAALEGTASSVEPGETESAPSLDTALPDRYFDQLRLGLSLLEKGDLELAELFLTRAQELFPEYAGGDSSYWLLASLFRQQERADAEERQLARMTAINAEHYEAQLRLARLRAERGDIEGAAAALDEALYIYPYDIDVHRELAGYFGELGRWEQAARERRAVLALNPVDLAEAHYRLADAYQRSGNRSSAREQILYALEIAPNYYRAQELLLALQPPPAPGQPAQ